MFRFVPINKYSVQCLFTIDTQTQTHTDGWIKNQEKKCFGELNFIFTNLFFALFHKQCLIICHIKQINIINKYPRTNNCLTSITTTNNNNKR